MKTSVLIPTRWRLEQFKALMGSIIKTAEGELEIIVGADTDDATDYGVKCIRYEDLGSSQKVYEMAKLATGDMMRVFSTDEIVRTKGWDTKLYARFPEDKLAVLATNDSPDKHRGGCVPVVSKEWYAIAGYYPRHFWHSYGDTWVVDIANRAKRFIFVEDVVVEHLKKTQGFRDKSNQRVSQLDNNRDKPGGRDLWNKTADEREELANKIKAAIND